MKFSSISEILSDIQKGQFVIMVDHQDRENEGDLILAAEFTTPDKINFLMKEARGLMCLAITEQHVAQLKLPLMQLKTSKNTAHQARFTYSIDALKNVTTGVSARERSETILTAIRPDTTIDDLVCPGHVFPIVARDGGVLEREGHTEAAVDLARMAGLNPAAVTCEILDEKGESANGETLRAFAQKYGLKVGRIEDLIMHRRQESVQ